MFNLKLLGKSGKYYLFAYEIDGEENITRVKPTDNGKNYELSIGFGDFRTKMIIETHSRMGKQISTQIENGERDKTIITKFK